MGRAAAGAFWESPGRAGRRDPSVGRGHAWSRRLLELPRATLRPTAQGASPGASPPPLQPGAGQGIPPLREFPGEDDSVPFAAIVLSSRQVLNLCSEGALF